MSPGHVAGSTVDTAVLCHTLLNTPRHGYKGMEGWQGQQITAHPIDSIIWC